VKRTAAIDTILNVLRHAKRTGLPLSAAVEDYRKELRAGMLRQRQLAKERPVFARSAASAVKRLSAESRRVRRLQLTYPSWRGDTSLAGLVRWHEQAIVRARNAERFGRSSAYVNRCYKMVFTAEDAMRRAGI